MLTIFGDKILGEGGFGVVYEGAWNGFQVAVLFKNEIMRC
jgi:hypothetical protein